MSKKGGEKKNKKTQKETTRKRRGHKRERKPSDNPLKDALANPQGGWVVAKAITGVIWKDEGKQKKREQTHALLKESEINPRNAKLIGGK